MSSTKIFPSQKSNVGSGSFHSIGNLSRQSSMSLDSKLRKQLADSIGVEEDDDDKFSIEQIRVTTKNFFTNSFLGEVYNNILLILSIFSCIQYIQQSYDQTPPSKDLLELCLAIIFTLDWCLCCFIADHKILFVSR